MPKSRIERAVFGGLMAFTMVYGMEVYNHAVRSEALAGLSLRVAIDEMVGLTLVVVLLQEFVGGPLARTLAARFVDLRSARPALATLTVSVFTVICMCPLMSLVTSVLFTGLDAQTPWRWGQAVRINFPMAFFWQMLVAGPLVRYLFRTLFPRPLPR